MYTTIPWTEQYDSLTENVWYTCKGNSLYATILFWPEENILKLAAPVEFMKRNKARVVLLGCEREPLKVSDLNPYEFFSGNTLSLEWLL